MNKEEFKRKVEYFERYRLPTMIFKISYNYKELE